MKQLISRLPYLTLTHSRWRGDFSRRGLAQSWADASKEADAIRPARAKMRVGFIKPNMHLKSRIFEGIFEEVVTTQSWWNPDCLLARKSLSIPVNRPGRNIRTKM